MERIDVAEFQARLKAQGVSHARHYAVVCPICGTVQSMASLVAAGARPEEAERGIAFSCEGRLTDAGPWLVRGGRSARARARRKVRGCDWTLGGLFQLHEIEVMTDDGKAHPRFRPATPDQARALEAKMTPGTGGAALKDDAEARIE